MSPPTNEKNEEEMFKRAIAMSLQEEEVELCSMRHQGVGELQKSISKSIQKVSFFLIKQAQVTWKKRSLLRI